MAKLQIEIEINDQGTPIIRQLGQVTAETGKKAEGAARGYASLDKKVEDTTRRFSELLTPANLAAAAIGTALVASLKSALTEATQFADEIHRLELLTGSSKSSLISLVDVANDVGVEFGQVQMALLRLANQSEETDGVLAQFNLTAKDGVGRLVEFAQKMSGVTDANQRAAIASEVFGSRIAAGLLPLLERLRGGMNALGVETNKFVAVFGEQGVEELRDFKIAMGQVDDALLGVKAAVSLGLLPLLAPLVAMLEKVVWFFAALPAPIQAAVLSLTLAVSAITALNAALRFFGITTLAMLGPAGWIAGAVTGIAVLIASVDNLGSKLTSLWTDFKNRGMTPVPALAGAATTGTPSGAPAPVILPKDVLEANDAIKKQIDLLKAQQIELEQGRLAALKYSLAHGEMAKASPALKAQLIALTQSIQDFKTEQELSTATLGDATDELKEIAKKEKELKQAIDDANKIIREQNLLFIDAGRYADELRQEVDDMIASVRESVSARAEDADVLERLKRLSPADAIRQQIQAIEEGIAALKRYKAESLAAYGGSAQVVKDVDREILKLTADQVALWETLPSFGNAFQKVFNGATDILSLFGVKVGRVILMLQSLPRALSGIKDMSSGLGDIAALLGAVLTPGTAVAGLEGASNTAGAIQQLGETAMGASSALSGMSQTAGFLVATLGSLGTLLLTFGGVVLGVIKMLASVTTLGAIGGSPSAAGGALLSQLSSLGSAFGNFASLIQGGLANSIQTIFTSLGASGSSIFSAGSSFGPAFGPGIAASLMARAIPIAGALIGIGLDFFKGNIAGGVGGVVGGAIGAYFGGPTGFMIGQQIGSLIGTLIGGLFKGPKPQISGKIQLTPTTLASLLATQQVTASQVVNPPGRSNFSFVAAGPVLAQMFKFRTQGSLDRAGAQAIIANIVLGTLQAAFTGLAALIPQLPTAALRQELTDRIEATLAAGFDITDFNFRSGSAKKVVNQFREFLKGLAGETLQVVTAQLFGAIDLSALGAGDAVKGFDALTQAMAVMSAIVKSVGGAVATFTPTLAEFAAGALEFFRQFQREGEELSATITRVSQDIQGLLALRDDLQSQVDVLSGGAPIGYMLDQFAQAQQRIRELADALLIAVESGAPPADILQAAQQARGAVIALLTAQIQAVTSLVENLKTLGGATASAAQTVAQLQTVITGLGRTPNIPTDDLIATLGLFFIYTQDIGARIQILGTIMQTAAGSLVTFSAAFPGIIDQVNTLRAQIQAGTDPAQAISHLQALAQAIQQGLSAAMQTVQQRTAQLQQQAEEASRARIAALNAEREALSRHRDAVQQAYQTQIQALTAQIDLARQWASTLQSTQTQLAEIATLTAPLHPVTSLNEAIGGFRQAVGEFRSTSSPDAAQRVQDVGRQLLQLAQQTPGFDLPSLAFQGLVSEVQAALREIQTVAQAQPTEAALQQRIAELEQAQADSLSAIDEAIRDVDERIALENDDLQDVLRELSQAEQSQLRILQLQAAATLQAIQIDLIVRMGQLADAQIATAARLQQLTGGLSVEHFIAQQQAQAVALLTSIEALLRQSLSNLVATAFPPTPPPASVPVGPKGPEVSNALEQLQGVRVPGGIIISSGMFIPSKLIGAEHGMEFVPQTGPVLLHRGEMVLPADEAARVRAGAVSHEPSITFSPTIHLQVVGSIDERREQEALDRIMSKIIQGPSRTKLALVEAVKRR